MVLTRFTAALERHKGELDLDNSTYWRYRGGRLPRILAWLARNPELAVALAEDAAELARTCARGADDTTRGGDA